MIIDVPAAAARILAYWDRATAAEIATGAAWYPAAFKECAELARLSRIDLETVAAVISHLSPQTRWRDNMIAARELLINDERAPGTLWDNYGRARRSIHATAPLDSFGPDAHKTRAFARAILGDVDAVVIDTWAVRIALCDGEWFRNGTVAELGKILKRRGVYAQIADAYRAAAAARGVDPTVMQAVTWGVCRGSFD